MSSAANVLKLHALLARVREQTWHFYAPYSQFHQKLLTPVLLGQALWEHDKQGAPTVVMTFAAVSDWSHQQLSQGLWPLYKPEHWQGGNNLWVLDVLGVPPYTARAVRGWKRRADEAGIGPVHWRRERTARKETEAA